MAKLLCKNGRVWDGERFFEADVLTDGPVIAKIEKGIEDEADYVYDAAGQIVSAGLVDIHVHFKGISSDMFGIHPAMCTLPFGVTAAADASGGRGDRALLDHCGVKNCVFVSSDIHQNRASFDNALTMMQRYGDKVVGLKVYFDRFVSEVEDITPLKQSVAFAQEHGLIVMVHSSNPPTTMAELLAALRPGDILTHAFHGRVGNVSEDDFSCLDEAKARGIWIDAGMAGYVHTDFTVMENAIAHGAKPDIISTDITRSSAYKRGGRYGLPMCMSIARHLGMEEAEILRCTTSTPAKALGRDWGRLTVGGAADLAVLAYVDEGFDMTDCTGRRIQSNQGYRNMLTIADGEVVYRS